MAELQTKNTNGKNGQKNCNLCKLSIKIVQKSKNVETRLFTGCHNPVIPLALAVSFWAQFKVLAIILKSYQLGIWIFDR